MPQAIDQLLLETVQH